MVLIFVDGSCIVDGVIAVDRSILSASDRLWLTYVAADTDDTGIIRGYPHAVQVVLGEGTYITVTQVVPVFLHL